MFLAKRLSPHKRTELLDHVLERIRATRAREPAVVVFDLDGTLMDNRPRIVSILHELAEEWRLKHPEAAARCQSATAEQVAYGFSENLKLLGVDDEQLISEGCAFWQQRFFADPHVRHDTAIPGASDFAHACYEAGAVIVYLTGRDLPNMALGSFASLRDLGFPISLVGTELITKPKFETPDSDFKREVVPLFSRIGPIVAFFDNEPLNCNICLEFYPESVSVLLDTQRAPEPPPLDPRAFVISSFERVAPR